MKHEQYKEQKFIQENSQNIDALEQMLQSAYGKDSVPNEAKIRLQNRIACQKAMEAGKMSFWWLPATIATVISLAVAVFIYLVYVIVNITGAHTWMPNLLQFVSEIWLKIHLVVLMLEVMLSWLVTLIGVWKGNLIKSAKIF